MRSLNQVLDILETEDKRWIDGHGCDSLMMIFGYTNSSLGLGSLLCSSLRLFMIPEAQASFFSATFVERPLDLTSQQRDMIRREAHVSVRNVTDGVKKLLVLKVGSYV